MDLLKYLEPMKNLPKRFSNLAFWRDVRKFKDDVVNAFEYVDSWGDGVERSISNIKYINCGSNSQFNLTLEKPINIPTTNFSVLNNILIIPNIYTFVSTVRLPSNYGNTIGISVTVTQSSNSVTLLGIAIPITLDGKIKFTANSLIGRIPSGSIDTNLPLAVKSAFLYYNPTK